MSRDRFGNDQIVVGLKPKKGKPDSFPRGYFEMGNKLFKVTTSRSKRDDVVEWVTITIVEKQNSQFGNSRQSSAFGGNNRR